MIKISKIKPNPNNPRFIRDNQFEQLKKSIHDFPDMMRLRPIIVDKDWIVQGGNMRLRALTELKYKEIPAEWVMKAEDLTEEQWKEFVIKDNIGFGQWDYDKLADWDKEKLSDWGVDTPSTEVNLEDYFEDFDDQPFNNSNRIVLNYTEGDYEKVKKAFDDRSNEGTKEQIVYKLLGL